MTGKMNRTFELVQKTPIEFSEELKEAMEYYARLEVENRELKLVIQAILYRLGGELEIPLDNLYYETYTSMVDPKKNTITLRVKHEHS